MDKIFRYHLSDSVTKPLPESTPSEFVNASPQQSFMRPQKRAILDLIASEIIPGHSQGSYGSANSEESPLQILSRNPEIEMISQGKPENITSQEKSKNRLLKVDQSISYSFENFAVKSKDSSKAETYSDIGKSRFASFVPATKLNQIISQRPDTLRNFSSNGLFSAILHGK